MRSVPLFIVLVLAAGCSRADTEARRTSSPEPSPSQTQTSTQALTPSPPPTEQAAKIDSPRPSRPLPRSPRKLATTLVAASRNLDGAVEEWLSGGARPGPRRHAVALHALYQQRLYRALVRRDRLAQRVLETLPRRWRFIARRNVVAGSGLRSLVTPVSAPVRLKTHSPDPPGLLLRSYKAAARRYGLEWEVLAAVNFVESRFGRLLGPSSAGALGPMQFLPSTWDAYGMGGNIRDPRDAIFGAANYLSASGAPARMRDALFAYNRSSAYVDAILLYASEIKRSARNFYAYYFWQVFVVTARGDVRLTGPGIEKR